MKKVIFALSAFLFLFTACKKNDSSPTTTYTKVDTLQSGQWKLTSATAFGGVYDLTSTMKACQKDNLYTFNANNTITVDEGATKCATTDVSPRTDGNWNLSADYKQMTVSGSLFTSLGITSFTADLVKLDATTLQMKKDTTISSLPTTINIIFTNVK
ncbi:MAG: lipocalin family protein [Phycisphaerales bacterium]|nr:lipocalin family protein [Phycisphaerales bacterium]